jgi:hypothetical protein
MLAENIRSGLTRTAQGVLEEQKLPADHMTRKTDLQNVDVFLWDIKFLSSAAKHKAYFTYCSNPTKQFSQKLIQITISI